MELDSTNCGTDVHNSHQYAGRIGNPSTSTMKTAQCHAGEESALARAEARHAWQLKHPTSTPPNKCVGHVP